MNLHTIRNLCLVILPFLFVLSIMLHFLLDVGNWAEYFYIISLTANIGYFTNFIAIKMLFKPYKKTALGRQGLIPRNQLKLASALSGTLNEHFLASEHWVEYLQKAAIMPKLLAGSQAFCEEWCRQPENMRRLFRFVEDSLCKNEKQLEQLFEQLQLQIIEEFSNDLKVETLLAQGFEWFENQFLQNPQQMMFMVEPVVVTLAENIPEIAQRLIKTVDQHIENQDIFKRNIAKAARWSANISEQDIREYLFRMVASAEFRATLFDGLYKLVCEYKKRSSLVSAEQSIDFKALLNELLKQQSASVKIIKVFTEYLNHPDNNQAISQLIKSAIPSVFIWLKMHLDHSRVEKLFIQQVVLFIETIDMSEIIEEKAASFSPRQMENIFQSMISDQLVFIELLGALLGALSGLALIDLRLFVGLSGLMLSYFGLDYYLSQKKQRSGI